MDVLMPHDGFQWDFYIHFFVCLCDQKIHWLLRVDQKLCIHVSYKNVIDADVSILICAKPNKRTKSINNTQNCISSTWNGMFALHDSF